MPKLLVIKLLQAELEYVPTAGMLASCRQFDVEYPQKSPQPNIPFPQGLQHLRYLLPPSVLVNETLSLNVPSMDWYPPGSEQLSMRN